MAAGITPYVPKTVWAKTAFKPKVWKPYAQVNARVYRVGCLSKVAIRVLDYIKLNNGAAMADIQRAIGVATISRQVKTLAEDGFITATVHPTPTSKAHVRCWLNESSTQPLEPNRHEEDYSHRQTTTPSYARP